MRLSWSCSKYSVICCAEKLLVSCYSCGADNHLFLDLPKQTDKDAVDDSKGRVGGGGEQYESFLGCNVSDCSEYLAAITSHKRLLVWRYADQQWTLYATHSMNKKPVDLVFDHHAEYIFVADKTGDVRQYGLSLTADQTTAQVQKATDSDDDEESARGAPFLLGHISMLLTMTMSRCGRYIASGDRDEKIKVSRYPHAHDIASFCMGHLEFISQLRPMESLPDTLLSASGDGCLNLWNLEDGRELCSIDTHPHSVKHRIIDTSNCKSRESVKPPQSGGRERLVPEQCAVTCVSVTSRLCSAASADNIVNAAEQAKENGHCPGVTAEQCNDTVTATQSSESSASLKEDIIATAFHRSLCLALYRATSDHRIEFITSMELPVPPSTLMWINSDTLVTVCPQQKVPSEDYDVVLVWRLSDQQLLPLPQHPLALFANKHLQHFTDVPEMDAIVLYKRRYDNVAEYQKKKQDRILQQKAKQQELQTLSCKRIKLDQAS